MAHLFCDSQQLAVEVLADLLVADEGVDEALCVLLLAAHEQEHLLAGGMQLQHTGTRAYPIVTTRPFPYFLFRKNRWGVPNVAYRGNTMTV